MWKKHGRQVRTIREIPCMPWIPRMQKYETTFRESRNPMPNVRRRSRLKENEKRKKILRMRKQSGMRIYVIAETIHSQM